MAKVYKVTPDSNPTTVFPFSVFFGQSKAYHQTLVTPQLCKKCTKSRAEIDVKLLHQEGWAARMVKYDTTIGPVYIVYERRTGREMTPKKGSRRLYKP
jgi:hypothetical protein